MEDARRAVMATLAEMMRAVATASTPDELRSAVAPLQLADGVLPALPAEPAQKALPGIAPAPTKHEALKATVLEVFEYWRTQTGHHAAQLTPNRESCIRARLKQGYSKDQLLHAIDGCCGSEFHAGKYDELTLILRNGEKVERFCDLAGELTSHHTQKAIDPEIDQLKALMRKAQREGRDADYERYNTQLTNKLRKAR